MASRAFRSVRARTTLGATVVVAVALLIGAFSFYGILSSSIHASAERAAEQRLDELAERFDGPGGGPGGERGVDSLDDEIVQIIGEAVSYTHLTLPTKA